MTSHTFCIMSSFHTSFWPDLFCASSNKSREANGTRTVFVCVKLPKLPHYKFKCLIITVLLEERQA